MEDLSSAEHKSVVDESSSIVLSLLKRDCVGVRCQMLSERDDCRNVRSKKGSNAADVPRTNG